MVKSFGKNTEGTQKLNQNIETLLTYVIPERCIVPDSYREKDLITQHWKLREILPSSG